METTRNNYDQCSDIADNTLKEAATEYISSKDFFELLRKEVNKHYEDI